MTERTMADDIIEMANLPKIDRWAIRATPDGSRYLLSAISEKHYFEERLISINFEGGTVQTVTGRYRI